MLFTRGEVSDIDVTLTYKYVMNHLTSRVSLLPDKVSNIKVRVQIQLTAGFNARFVASVTNGHC